MAEFIDYNTYAALNQDEEQRLLEEAMLEAERSDAEAQKALASSRQQAAGRYNERGEIQGMEADITQTGSYTDYLKARDNAAMLRQRAASLGGDPRRAALRQNMLAGGAGDRLGAMGEAADAREAAAKTGVADQYAAIRKNQQDEMQRRQTANDAAAERQREQQAFREQYNANIANALRDWSARGPATGFGRQQANELSYLWQAGGRTGDANVQGAMKQLDERFKTANASPAYTFRINNYNKGGY